MNVYGVGYNAKFFHFFGEICIKLPLVQIARGNWLGKGKAIGIA